MKTIIYVDGYNLFYGCLKHSQDKWLDVYQLLYRSVVHEQTPSSELVSIKFFTADIQAKVATHGQAAQQAQQLSAYANWTRKHITDRELSESHLPFLIPTKKKPIVKPEYW